MEFLNFYIGAAGCLLAWVGLRLTLILLPTGTEKAKKRKEKAERFIRKVSIGLVLSFVILALIGTGFVIRRWMIHREEETVKRVLRESQSYELSLYTNPKEFKPSQLDLYWVSVEHGGKTAKDIECAVKRLLLEERYYGKDSNVESFDFDSVNISGDKATIETRESWHLPMYSATDGTQISGRRAEQSWKAKYYLKKNNGKWLIEDTTLPYKKGPPC